MNISRHEFSTREEMLAFELGLVVGFVGYARHDNHFYWIDNLGAADDGGDFTDIQSPYAVQTYAEYSSTPSTEGPSRKDAASH